MPSISELLIEQGRVLADQRRRSGERRAAAVSGLGQIPGAIMAGRAAQAAAARKAALEAEDMRLKRSAEARAGVATDLAINADVRAQGTYEHEQQAEQRGREAVMGWMKQHAASLKPEEAAKMEAILQMPGGTKHLVDVLMKAPEGYTLSPDQVRFGPDNTEVARGIPKPVEEKPVTFGTPARVVVNGRRTTARPGSDDRWYIGGKPVEGDVQLYDEPKNDRQLTESGLSPTMEANVINRLSTQWTKAVAPVAELDRQGKLMDAGLDAARRGDIAQGAETLLVTFQKILDPTSVVRETEAMRSVGMQSLMNRAQGAFQRIKDGGAGLPIAEQEKYARLAKELIGAQARGYIDAQKARIGKTADRYKIPRDLVFEEYEFTGDAGTSKTDVAPRDTRTVPAEGTKGSVGGVKATWKTVNGKAGWYAD